MVRRYIEFMLEHVEREEYWRFLEWIEQQLKTFDGNGPKIRSFLNLRHQNFLRLMADFELRLKLQYSKNRRSWRMPKWIAEDPEILSRIKETQFLKIFEYAWERVIPDSLAEKICGDDKLHDGATGKRCAVFIPDYSTMSEELNISQPSVKTYLAAFCHYGIFRKLGKAGPRGNMIYAVGYYQALRKTKHGAILRPTSFLRKTPEMTESLRNFRVRVRASQK